MKKVCVFCGSSMGSNPIYKEKALELADYLIEHNMTLLYGGADVGLMKILADRMMEANKTVIGVMPSHLVQNEVAHHGITELIEVETGYTENEAVGYATRSAIEEAVYTLIMKGLEQKLWDFDYSQLSHQ